MGRTQKRGAADPLADELRWYFQHSESELGMQSSFGAFVDMAMSGIQPGGRSNGAERRAAAIASRLDRPAQRHRAMRRRLQALGAIDPLHVRVIHAAYGPANWTRMADDVFGRGTGERLARALGAEHIGVALLTGRLARFIADDAPCPESVCVDGNRWDLAAVSPDGEALYRCAGPTMVVHDVRTWEGDESLRERALEAAGGPRTGAGERLLAAAGAELDAEAREAGVRRRSRTSRQILATGKASRDDRRTDPGVALVGLVLRAYPTSAPKTAAKRQAAAAALAVVNAIRDEAVLLLQRARVALPPAEERRRPALPTGPRRQTGEAFVPPALRKRPRPVVAFEAFSVVVDHAAPAQASATRWM
ncbi:hypothetical protein [Sorangium sp. So ce1024]|uniref:hypothetical protein n=1 Tax=Sorangium sp. So ce1024 TaxID=3133327 RepID=UPI003F0A7BFD